MIRNRVLCAVFVGGLAAAACSQQGPAASSNGGSSGANGGSGGSSSSVANGGSGGSNEGGSNAGGSAAGGSNAGGSAAGGSNAGGSAAGGSAGKGSGGSAAGGASGSGGVAQGGSSAGDAAAGGSAAGGATTPAGSGGATPKGGAVGSGGAGSGGAVGSGGAAAGGSTGGGLAAEVVPDLAKGFYWEGTCAGTITVDGHNCPMTGTGSTCPSGGRNMDTTFKVGGDSTKKYTVNIEVRGVSGTRCYTGGKAASTAAVKEDDYNNWWYAGGSPYNATGWWNTYELHVSPSTGDASKDVYYFNNSSNTAGDGGDCEREASYLVGYTASFVVMGGGSLQFRIHDNNCKAIQNCGKVTDKSAPCSPRTVDLSKVPVQPPSSAPAAKQPPKNDTWYPQWMWIVATSVTAS